MLDDVLMNIKDLSRIIVCGSVSSYNNISENQSKNENYYRLKNYPRLIIKRAVMKGFIFFDYASEFPQAYKELYDLMEQGKLKIKIDWQNGIDECPNALIRLLKG
jgi:NADPH-dependent curcumin reductase CurA